MHFGEIATELRVGIVRQVVRSSPYGHFHAFLAAIFGRQGSSNTSANASDSVE
jgi:hypothetical protein